MKKGIETVNENLNQFSKEASNFLGSKEYTAKGFADIRGFPLLPKQAFYVMHWKDNKIAFQRNIEKLLGYKASEFNMNISLNAIHQDDKPIATRVTKSIVKHYIHSRLPGPDSYLTITYRLLKKDGTYLKILRQTGAYEISYDGILVSNWSLLTAIDFISNNNRVEWHLNTNEVDYLKFKDRVYKEFQDFFTAKELLVIHALKNGLKSADIANELHISIHTVLTHRKNIHRKSGCSNKEQLLQFCFSNGIL